MMKKSSFARLLGVALLLGTALMLGACQAAPTQTLPSPEPTSTTAAPIPTDTPTTAPLPPTEEPGYPVPTNPGEIPVTPKQSEPTAYPMPGALTTPEMAAPPSAGPETAYPPAKGDEAMKRGNFFLDSTTLLPIEGKPGQADVYVEGSLPTPCHEPRVMVEPPNDQNQIIIDLYSVVDPNMICTQVLKPFNGKVTTLSGYPSGKYTIIVNGEPAGELTVP